LCIVLQRLQSTFQTNLLKETWNVESAYKTLELFHAC
jgi:hypothetical protein